MSTKSGPKNNQSAEFGRHRRTSRLNFSIAKIQRLLFYANMNARLIFPRQNNQSTDYSRKEFETFLQVKEITQTPLKLYHSVFMTSGHVWKFQKIFSCLVKKSSSLYIFNIFLLGKSSYFRPNSDTGRKTTRTKRRAAIILSIFLVYCLSMNSFEFIVSIMN